MPATATLNEEEPCDPERFKILEEAMQEAIHAYMSYIDPHNRISREEFVDRLIGLLDRRAVAKAANAESIGEPAAPAADKARSVRSKVSSAS